MYGYDTVRVNGVKLTPEQQTALLVLQKEIEKERQLEESRYTHKQQIEQQSREKYQLKTSLSQDALGQRDYQMTKEEYYTFVEKTFSDMLALIKRKNADYCGKGDDPFANFRRAERVGVDPLKGLAVRFEDKVARVESFFQNGNLQNESLEDAFLDIIGYSCLALGMLEEAKRS